MKWLPVLLLAACGKLPAPPDPCNCPKPSPETGPVPYECTPEGRADAGPCFPRHVDPR